MKLTQVFLPAFAALACVGEAHIKCANNIPAAECAALNAGNFIAPRYVNCQALTGVLSCLKGLGAPATRFCSSYLHLPSATTITTTSTPPASTQQVVVTVVTTTYYFESDGFKKKRADAARAMVHAPEARGVAVKLFNYGAAEISSACRCLNITPQTTVTVQSMAPTPVTTQFSTTTNVITSRTCNASGSTCGPNCNPHMCCGGACTCGGFANPPGLNTCIR